MSVTAPDTLRISLSDLEALLARIFLRNGCNDAVARELTCSCAGAERDGSTSHGVFWVDGRAEPKVQGAAPGFLRVDAASGFAQPAMAAAREMFADKARRNGVALLAIGNSHHLAALWPDIEPFADTGMIALAMANSMACSVPAGARHPVFGTNPIAFAAPVAGGAPMVFDIATTTMANGDVQLARPDGRTLYAGSAPFAARGTELMKKLPRPACRPIPASAAGTTAPGPWPKVSLSRAKH